MYQIITDSGCDFTAAEIKKHGIEVLPFYICVNDEEHLREGIDITKEEYFNRLVSEKDFSPKTAQPSPQDYIDVYTPHLKAGKDILTLTISSKLSGTHNSATLAAQMLKDEYPKQKIVIIDSLNVSIGQQLILHEILKMQKAGFSLQQTKEYAKQVIKSTHVYFTLDTMVYLRRGGRIGPTTAFVGGLLKLRPIIQLEDGAVNQLDSVRGKKNALKMIEEAIVYALKDNLPNINMNVGHVLCATEAADFKQNTENALGTKITAPIAEIGAAIGTHTGPGAIGFAYCRKYESFMEKEMVGGKAA